MAEQETDRRSGEADALAVVERAHEAAAALLRGRSASSPGADPSDGLIADRLAELLVALDELRDQHDQVAERQQALEAQRRHFQELFDRAPDAYLLTDRDGIIRMANVAAQRLLDPGGRPLRGQALESLVLPRDQPRFRARLRSAGEGVEQHNWQFGVAAHTQAAVQVAAEVTAGTEPDERTVELRWLLRDVTDSRRAQAALRGRYRNTRQEAAELRELDRWKDAFMAAAAHDLRAPLAVITTAAETLLARPDVETEKRTVILRTVLAQSARLKRLLDDLLDLSRYAQGRVVAHRRPANLATLIDRAVGAVDHPDHPVTVDVPAVTVDVDGPRVEQIVGNLLRNAVRHTGRGTPVRVVGTTDGDAVVLVVEDDGPGFDEDLGGRIFEPFVTQVRHDAAELGTGLGLTLVQLFAELHGGHAHAANRPEGGACVTVRLPAALHVP